MSRDPHNLIDRIRSGESPEAVLKEVLAPSGLDEGLFDEVLSGLRGSGYRIVRDLRESVQAGCSMVMEFYCPSWADRYKLRLDASLGPRFGVKLENLSSGGVDRITGERRHVLTFLSRKLKLAQDGRSPSSGGLDTSEG